MKNKNGCIFSIREASRSKVSLAISGVLLLVVNPTQADEFIPQLKAHGKPSPFGVMPLYDLNQPGGELPYVQPQAEPIQGAIDTVVHSSSRTAVVGTSYNSATGGHETFADVRKKGSKFYGRAIIVDETANEYDGESGEEVRFGYDRQAGQLVLGTTPRSSTDVKLVYVRDIIEDNKNPVAIGTGYNNGTLKVAEGYGVDPIDTDRQIAKLMWDEKVNGSVIQDFHLEFSSISLDRTADNYSLRETPTAQQQKTKVDRTVNGFKADSDLMVIGAKVNLALDYSYINHDAKRYGGPNTAGLDYVSAYHYPGVEMDEWLLSAVSEFDVTTTQRVTFGVNYKYVDATATKATLSTNTPGAGNMSAIQLYQTYYGDVDLDQSEGNFSAKLKWDYDNSSDMTAYASVANVFRSPDTQERYFAATSFSGAQDQPVGTSARAVGNPNIEWEQHRRIEAGLGKSSDNWVNYGRTRGHGMAWDIATTVYYDDINDFITRDRARGQSGVYGNDYARIWRNVDATMSALEIDVKANLTKKFASRLVLNVIDGENTTDDRNLYYISPFEGNLFFDYSDYLSTGGTWNIGTQIRYVAEQNSVDADPTTGSGYDGDETGSFTTVGLYASVQLADRYGIKVGVDNLTNESYADSMAKFSLEGNRVLVEAPERSFYLAVTANF